MERNVNPTAEALAFYVVFVFSATVHEAAHAWAAMRGGDPTAYLGGQVSLDPIPHIRREPFGMVLMPVLSLALFGWPFGYASTPYDPRWAFRFPKRAAWMALAGPVSNLALAAITAIIIRVGLATGYFEVPHRFSFTQLVETGSSPTAMGLGLLVSVLFSMTVLLFVLNLLPMPPLDGSAVLGLVLSDSAARRLQEILHQPMFSILGIIVAWRVFGFIFWPIFAIFVRLLYPSGI